MNESTPTRMTLPETANDEGTITIATPDDVP